MDNIVHITIPMKIEDINKHEIAELAQRLFLIGAIDKNIYTQIQQSIGCI
ncbi:hypothetical protein [Clostridium brassicae]|uniref:Uncharacterized protein n=1 Tax=Clostridium brassicae TaxID=2999072 RepID=A0ABT4D9W5_9CLOT|nr:hypothetical protein [Clostridium brassicae]MCY6959075.1 hypothetical protein [Clostridium brassicae]